MTADEAIEAGLLAAAFRALPELISECEAEATGQIDENSTRWKTLALEVWGQDHHEDSSQEHVGPTIALPPTMAAKVLEHVRIAVQVRLGELGVMLE